MKSKQRISVPAVGGSSLLVIFAVLCLVVLALLSVSTVQAEKRMADTAAEAVTAYYAADLKAQEIFARLRSGEQLPDVREENGIYSFCCRISGSQVLEAEVEKTENKWCILRWQVVSGAEAADEILPVWDGA